MVEENLLIRLVAPQTPSTPPTVSNHNYDFWIDEQLTQYLRNTLAGEPIQSLQKHTVMIAVHKKTLERTFIIYDGTDVIADATAVDAIAVKCDALRLKHEYEEGEK